MTSRGSATMTSLTDHSVESILRDSDSKQSTSNISSAIAGHVSYTTGNEERLLTQRGERCVMPAEVVLSESRAGVKARVELECPDLWCQFYTLCTEMVITKSGRLIPFDFYYLQFAYRPILFAAIFV